MIAEVVLQFFRWYAAN